MLAGPRPVPLPDCTSPRPHHLAGRDRRLSARIDLAGSAGSRWVEALHVFVPDPLAAPLPRDPPHRLSSRHRPAPGTQLGARALPSAWPPTCSTPLRCRARGLLRRTVVAPKRAVRPTEPNSQDHDEETGPRSVRGRRPLPRIHRAADVRETNKPGLRETQPGSLVEGCGACPVDRTRFGGRVGWGGDVRLIGLVLGPAAGDGEGLHARTAAPARCASGLRAFRRCGSAWLRRCGPPG